MIWAKHLFEAIGPEVRYGNPAFFECGAPWTVTPPMPYLKALANCKPPHHRRVMLRVERAACRGIRRIMEKEHQSACAVAIWTKIENGIRIFIVLRIYM